MGSLPVVLRMIWLLDDVREAFEHFGTAAGVDPISGVLIVVAAVLLSVAIGAVVWLSVGAVLSLVRGTR